MYSQPAKGSCILACLFMATLLLSPLRAIHPLCHSEGQGAFAGAHEHEAHHGATQSQNTRDCSVCLLLASASCDDAVVQQSGARYRHASAQPGRFAQTDVVAANTRNSCHPSRAPPASIA